MEVSLVNYLSSFDWDWDPTGVVCEVLHVNTYVSPVELGWKGPMTFNAMELKGILGGLIYM